MVRFYGTGWAMLLLHADATLRHDVGKRELDAQQRRQEARWESLSPGQKVSDFVRRHEYGVIVGSWAVAMAGALRYVMKDP